MKPAPFKSNALLAGLGRALLVLLLMASSVAIAHVAVWQLSQPNAAEVIAEDGE